MILHDLLNEGVDAFEKAQLFYGHGTDNAWDEAVVLVSHVLQLPPDAQVDVLQWPLSDAELGHIRELFQQRIERKIPAAYLTGHAWFAGMEFIVTPDVLVPRSPFAELIANAFTPWLMRDPNTILDLCTGSGCIGIATAMCFPGATVDLSDVSAAALAVAQQNITKYELTDRVSVIESDGLSALTGKTYDLIVCNPPYVDAQDFATMPAEFHAEPELGLVSGEDGLDFTRRLLAEAANYLAEDGCLFVEVGNSWEALEQAYPNVPFMWIEFEFGGHGVFILNAAQLREYKRDFLQGAKALV